MDETNVSHYDLYDKELYVRGTRIRVDAQGFKYISASKIGIVEIKFLDVPDDTCYNICEEIEVIKDYDDGPKKVFRYNGKINIKNLSLVKYGSELSKVLYGQEK